MTQSPALIPWSTDVADLLDRAATTPGGACCLFVISRAIPNEARSGYATLVMAYTRESEPIAVLDDGSAVLLVVEGGADGGATVGERVLAQLEKLGLRATVRAGVVPTTMPADVIIERAREAALAAQPGEVAVAH